MDEDSWENTSVQSLKDDGDTINKETQLNLGERPKGDIWQHFNEINNRKGKHKEAICNLKSHLAMKCKKHIPKDI